MALGQTLTNRTRRTGNRRSGLGATLSPTAALEDALEPKTGGFTFPNIPGGNMGGPPSRSFLTTNTATGPDRLGTNQFIPNDYGAAMRQMQGDGSLVAPPATGGFDQSRMTVNSAASATGSMGSPPSSGLGATLVQPANRPPINNSVGNFVRPNNNQPSMFDQFFADADAGIQRSPEEYQAMGFANTAPQPAAQPSLFDQFFREADAGIMRTPEEYRAMGFANQVDYTGMPTVEGDGTGVTNVGTGAFDPQSYVKLGINDQTTERAKAVANQFATRANPVIKKQFATKAAQPGTDKTATEATAAGTDITTRQANVGADKTASSLGSFGRGVKTPYTALGLPDNLQVGTGDAIGSESVNTGADMVQRELLNRSLSNTLINPTDTLATSAEANVLNRLSGNQLSDSTAIDEALAAAQVRLAESGVGLGGDLVSNAEKVIQDRLLGETNPLSEQQRADFLRRSDQQQDQLREQLNRLGVLRSGDTAEAFGDFIGARERTLNDIDARAYDLQSQALADALNFQGRRDSLGLANENLARAAIGDVAGLAGQIDDRKVLQAGLAGDAVSQALGLQSRRDQLDIAGSELRRQAQQDVFGRQAQLSGLETDRINRQIARDQANRAERGLRSDLVTAEQQRRLAGVADQRASEALASSLTSEDLQRQLAIAGDVRAADALGSSLTTERLERLLATATDTREAEALGSRLTSEQLERQLATASDARSAEALGSDLTTQAQQRRLASAADARAAQGLGSDLTTQLLQRQLALAGDARAADALSSDLTTQNLLRNLQVNEDLRERQALGDTFATTSQQRQLASAADQRAQRALNQDILDQQLQRDLAGRADIRAGDALESDLDTAELQRRLAQAEVTGRFDTGAANQAPLATLQSRALDSDLATQRQQRELARVSDLRAGRALDADIAAQNLQNRLAQSAVTGEFQTGANRAPISTLAQQQFDLQRQLALSGDERAQQQLESALFGAIDGEDGRQQTLTGRAFDADVASQNLQNRLAEAGVTGRFQRGANMPAEQTLQAQLAQQDIESAIQNREIQEAADARADRALGADISAQNFQNRLAQAGLTGELDFGGSRPAEQTLQAQAQFDAAERADRALDADIAAQNLQNRLAQAGVTGQLEFGGGRRPEQTLQAQALLQDIASQQAADARAERGLTSDLAAQQLQNRLAEADVTGDFFARGMGGPATRTLRAQALDQEIAASQGAESRAERAIQDALFGSVDGADTLSGRADQRAGTGFDREIRDLDVQQTLALAKSGYLNTAQRDQILNNLLGGIISGTDTNTTVTGNAGGETGDGTRPPLPPGARIDPFSDDRAFGSGGEVYILRQMGNEMSWEML